MTTSKDGAVKIWDIAAGKEKHTLRGHQGWVETVAISPDDQIVVTGGTDQTLRFWDANNGADKGKMELQEGGTLTVAFSPDGKWLASAGYDMTIRIWDVEKQKPLAILGKHNDAIWALAFSRDGLLASGSSDTTTKLWNVADKKEIAVLPTSDRKPIQALTYAPDGKFVALAKEDKTVQVCDAKNGNLLHVLRGHAGVVTCVAFSATGDTLASGSIDKTVKLWDPATGNIKHTLADRPGIVTVLLFMPDGKKLAVGRADGTIQLCNAASGEELETLKPDAGPIRTLACARDGRLAIGGDDPVVKIFDPAKPGQLDLLKGHEGPVRALAFAADGVLASAGDDGTIKIWEAKEAKERFTLKGHDGAALALAFSPTGKTLVSGGADGTVRLWNPRTGQAASTLRQHSAPITALAMHPAGTDVLSGSKDTLALRWPRAAAGLPVLPLIFRHDFRGTTIDKDFLKFTTKGVPGWLSQEAEGLRVSPPAVVPRGAPSGVMTTFRLRGDFDVLASYEILQAQISGTGAPIGVILLVTTDTPTQDAVSVSRFNRQDGSFYICSGKMTTPIDQKRLIPPVKAVRTDVVAGQLRLVRQGKVVRFLVADEGADGFQELKRLPLGDEDALYVRLAVDPGNKESPPVVARFRSIEVRGRPVDLKVSPAGIASKSPEKKLPEIVAKGSEKKSAPKRDYAQEYRQAFKETLAKTPGWDLMIPTTTPEEVSPGPEGLRIALPLGHDGRRQGVGLATDFGVKGDFEITLRFEMLKEPDPADTVGMTGLSLRVDLEDPADDFASLSRNVAPKGNRFVSFVRKAAEAKGTNVKVVPTNAKTGQLRLVRTGSMLSHYAAEEASDDFVFLCAHPFGDADLKRICITGGAGGPKSSLDVRVTDLRIRADSIPWQLATPLTPVATDSRSTGHWLLALLVVLGGACFLALLLGTWLLLRRRPLPDTPKARPAPTRKPAKAEPPKSTALASPATQHKETKPETSANPLVFPCSGCGKKIKVRADLAGKKVQCPQCGKGVLPTIEADDPGLASA